jgi:hypothetical protein
MRYDHECPVHGVFEVQCSVQETARTWPCPAEVGPFELAGGQTAGVPCGQPSPKCLNRSVQTLIPAHFQTTLPTTGLKTNTGGSGEFENLKSDFNRWDSGAPGMTCPQDKARAKERKQKLHSFKGAASV